MSNNLNVYYEDRLVGKLSLDEESQNFHFTYNASWCEDGFVISPHIKFDTPPSSGTIKKFLDNLLPEGKGLEVFSLFFHITKNNTLALTREIGNETSGALSFFEHEIQTIDTITRAININELTNRIKVEDPIQLIIWDGKPRLSVAGVQDKLPIIYENGKYSFGEGKLASTHILKFETERQRHLVINEYICMTLASKIGLDVAEVSLERFDDKPALLVKRFDRVKESTCEVKRLHIIDGCQALDLAPTHKYERNQGTHKSIAHVRDGVSFKKLFSFSNSCKNPIKTKLTMLRWAFYNLIISNSDAHGKNISFFIDKNGFTLTPFYDMVSIGMYPEFEQELSMAYGDNFSIKPKASDIAKMCKENDIHLKLASKELTMIAEKLRKECEENNFESYAHGKDEIVFVNKLKELIIHRCDTSLIMAKELYSI